MLEFEILEELKPNNEILKTLKNYTYTIKNGKTKHLLHTNLQFIEPIEYLITYPITLTILEYKVNEISNKPFYINEAENMVSFLIESYKEKYKLTEKKKENNELEWVKIMNNFKNMAEEFVLNELIYN